MSRSSPSRRKPRSASPQPSGELALIERIRRRAALRPSKNLRLGIGDDCAILNSRPGNDVLVTTDFSVEGRHFRRDWHSAASIGHRTLARGLSDLAAMGADPLAAFLSLALPKPIARDDRWLDGFLDGLLALAQIHRVPLAGGDTAGSPGVGPLSPILADIVLLGSASAGEALLRSTARPGDLLFCTGALGGAAAELRNLAANPRVYRRALAAGDHPHLFPQPRLAVGRVLRRRALAAACIDISDGLSTDLAHLCTMSKVAAELDSAAIPLHPLAQALGPAEALRAALHGGEDYELLFSARPTAKLPRSIAGVPITRIGRILPARKGRPQITLVADSGKRSTLVPQGWEHLR